MTVLVISFAHQPPNPESLRGPVIELNPRPSEGYRALVTNTLLAQDCGCDTKSERAAFRMQQELVFRRTVRVCATLFMRAFHFKPGGHSSWIWYSGQVDHNADSTLGDDVRGAVTDLNGHDSQC